MQSNLVCSTSYSSGGGNIVSSRAIKYNLIDKENTILKTQALKRQKVLFFL